MQSLQAACRGKLPVLEGQMIMLIQQSEQLCRTEVFRIEIVQRLVRSDSFDQFGRTDACTTQIVVNGLGFAIVDSFLRYAAEELALFRFGLAHFLRLCSRRLGRIVVVGYTHRSIVNGAVVVLIVLGLFGFHNCYGKCV